MSADQLIQLDLLGPALAKETGDDRWRILEAALIAGGKSNLTFELTSDAGALILRRPPSGDLLPSAHDMAREARIQKALSDTPVPVASVVMEDSGDLIGVPFYIMEKVIGHIIRAELPAGYATTGAEKQAMSFALIDTLAALHSADADELGLSNFGKPNGYMDRQLGRWASQWEKSKSHDVSAIDELCKRLQRDVPGSKRATIVHGDYRLDNCLMDIVNPSHVAAVLDWELSTLGDPLSDLGLLLFYWRETGEPQLRLTPSVTHLDGFPKRGALIERYARQTGGDLDDIAFYEAFANLKFAVIAQGIAARVAAGSMAGQDFGDLDSEILRIAEEGLAKLDRKDI